MLKDEKVEVQGDLGAPSKLLKLSDKTGCAWLRGQKAPLPVTGPGNHNSQSPVMTQTENGTTNPNPPPYDGVTSWSESTHILIDMTTFLFSN